MLRLRLWGTFRYNCSRHLLSKTASSCLLGGEKRVFLKSLEIFGFKSFATRTVIAFSDGITALLGPNGCGKSNVVDAVKWVLAENKAKNLRASSMEDVIFNGSDTRAALSMAEVTLTVSNEENLLPIDCAEVALKRRLYRNGENQYFINGKQVTAGTVKKLFMDTGVGKAAYSVMEQGKIDLILSSKPEDRRYFFEEVAGISRAKVQAAEAGREVERAKANLEQIEGIIAVSKDNYESLKEQTEKTLAYQKLKDEEFEAETDIQLLRLRGFLQSSARQQEERLAAEKKRDALEFDIEELSEAISVKTQQTQQMQQDVDAKQKSAIQLQAEQNGKKALALQLSDNCIQAKGKIAQIESSIESIQERIDSYDEQIDAQEDELRQKTKRLSEIEANAETFRQSIQASSVQIEENTKSKRLSEEKTERLACERKKLTQNLTSVTEDIVCELDSKLKAAGYSSGNSKRAKAAQDEAAGKLKAFLEGRAAIMSDFLCLSHTKEESERMNHEAAGALTQAISLLEDLILAIKQREASSPSFIDEFLSPEGIVTKKRSIDRALQDNIDQEALIEQSIADLARQNEELSTKIQQSKETLSSLLVNQAKMQQQLTSSRTQLTTLKQSRALQQASLKERQDELFGEQKRQEEAQQRLEQTTREIEELEVRGKEEVAALQELEDKIAQCTASWKGQQEELSRKSEQKRDLQKVLERLSIQQAQNETEIRNVKENFRDNYSRELSEFENRMNLIEQKPASLKERLASLKGQIAALGTPNLMATEQFAYEKERYEKLVTSRDDTQKTIEGLERVEQEIKAKSAELFMSSYNKIKKNFHNMFRRMMDGGKAELRLLDPSDVLTSGIEIFAQPPGKKLVNISLLSGGEKTMTAVALLFAAHQVKASPFCFLDEIDAALDDKNVASFVSTLRAFRAESQYVVITHNRKTVLGASSMLGATMEESGVTKVVQLRLDEDTLNGDIEFSSQEDFAPEDVAEEVGVVLPERPPRRQAVGTQNSKVAGGAV